MHVNLRGWAFHVNYRVDWRTTRLSSLGARWILGQLVLVDHVSRENYLRQEAWQLHCGRDGPLVAPTEAESLDGHIGIVIFLVRQRQLSDDHYCVLCLRVHENTCLLLGALLMRPIQ